MTLQATFVRHRQRRDRIYVTRGDGTSTSWDFPTYGDRLPHDLVHLVVEDGLGLDDGFWGLVDDGMDVGLVDNQPTLLRDGRPLAGQVGIDFSGLVRAEDAVFVVASPPDPSRPVPGSAETVAATRWRLHDLGRQWRALPDGGAITVAFGDRHRAQS
ncbi:MAG: hypothetical protein ACRDY1_01965 [Acidimicrobiales bacterium]